MAGAHVTLVARTAEDIEEGAAEARELGGAASAFPADVCDRAQVENAFEFASQISPVDIVVASAGANRTGPSVEITDDDWDVVFNTNVRATFLVFRAAAARLLAANASGSLIAMSSQMGEVGYPERATYCASKHAVNGLVKAMAVEWASADITVNAVSPTFILTPLTKPMLADPEFRREVESRIPMGRIGETGDVVGAVIYLASDASRFVTGHALRVDGGWVAW